MQCLRLRLLHLRFVDEVQFVHPAQHIALAQLGPLGIGHRVIGGGCLGQPGEHRGLGDRDVLQWFAEVDLRRGGKAVGALSEVDLVDIDLEDLVLGQIVLDFESQ